MSCNICGGVAYTCCFRYLNRKKSSGVRSSKCEGQSSTPPYPIIWFPNSLIKYYFTTIVVLFHLESQAILLHHVALQFFAWELIISSFVQVLWHHIVGNNIKTTVHFNHSILCINVHKVSFFTKLMMLYNFVKYFFFLSHSIFKIGMLMTQFSHQMAP